MTTLFGQPVRQLAYFVPDVREAALHHVALFGSGPFFYHSGLKPFCLHLEREQPIEMTIALGQWGSMMVEFIQQDNVGPSVFRDVFPAGSGRFGFHHVAVIVSDLAQATAAAEAAGYSVVARFRPDEGYDVVFLKAQAPVGHMLELYQAVEPVLGVYDFVADAAKDFDGREPLRPLVPA